MSSSATPTKENGEETEQVERDPDAFPPEGFTVIHEDEAGPESEGYPHYLPAGTRVQVVRGDHAGRMGSIQDVSFPSVEEHIKAHTNNPARKTATPDGYSVLTRDARNEVLYLKPRDVEELDQRHGWGRGQI